MPSALTEFLFHFFLLRLVGGNTQGPQKPAVVGSHIRSPAGTDNFGRSGNFCNRPALLARPVHEPDDGFQSDSHFETGRARFLAASFHLRIIGDCSGNGVGELTSQPVDNVIHWFDPPFWVSSPYKLCLRTQASQPSSCLHHWRDRNLSTELVIC